MDFVGGGGSGTGGLGSDNGPILYSEPNRTSAIDDPPSIVLYIFIITIILGFLLILPGVRSEKFPTFLCITTSIIVTSIILVVLFGTTWHVGQALISGPYKAFSKDLIQGELSVNIGLRSVNITLRAHKYYEPHVTHPVPFIMEHATSTPTIIGVPSSTTTKAPNIQRISSKRPSVAASSSSSSSFIETSRTRQQQPAVSPQQTTTSRPFNSASNLADELLSDTRNGEDPTNADTEIEVDEVFANSDTDDSSSSAAASRRARSSSSSRSSNVDGGNQSKAKRSVEGSSSSATSESGRRSSSSKEKRNTSNAANGQKYTIVRSNVDINYNERFSWVEPDQMRQEHHNALNRGLPYPILTVVEYLSQDEGGFSWSRQYRMAGYYSYIILWLAFCACILMFILHCAAPKYGIYTMQVIGCLLLFTNFTYATLVPKGDRKLVIPFEGQSISLEFGWNYWLVFTGGCLSLIVGTLFVIIDILFPNFIFTTILDVDFDSHTRYYRHQHNRGGGGGGGQEKSLAISGPGANQNHLEHRPVKPPFLEHTSALAKIRNSNSKQPSTVSSSGSSGSIDTAEVLSVNSSTGSHLSSSVTVSDKPISRRRSSAVKLINTASSSSSFATTSTTSTNEVVGRGGSSNNKPKASHLSELFVGPLIRQQTTTGNTFLSHLSPTAATGELTLGNDSEIITKQTSQEAGAQLKRGELSVVEMLENSDTYLQQQNRNSQPVVVGAEGGEGGASRHKSHYGGHHTSSQHTTNKSQTMKNTNLKTTDDQTRRSNNKHEAKHSNDDRQVRL